MATPKKTTKTTSSKKTTKTTPVETPTDTSTTGNEEIRFYYLRNAARDPIAAVAYRICGDGKSLEFGVSFCHPYDRGQYSRKAARGLALERLRSKAHIFQMGEPQPGIHVALRALVELANSPDYKVKLRHHYAYCVNRELKRRQMLVEIMNDRAALLAIKDKTRRETLLETANFPRQLQMLDEMFGLEAKMERMRLYLVERERQINRNPKLSDERRQLIGLLATESKKPRVKETAEAPAAA